VKGSVFLDDSVKEAENGVFDYAKSGRSSGGFDTKRHGNVKSKADYRRVKKYYKSAGRWRVERERRKRVLRLREEGLSYAEIAERLSVSERTVKRDMAKMKPYYERKVRSYWRRLEADRRAELEAKLEGLSLVQRFNILTKEIVKQKNLFEERKYRRSMMTLTVDLDNTTSGFPAVDASPKPPFEVKMPFTINLEFVKEGKKWKKCSIVVGSRNRSKHSLA
jgi:transposase